MHEMTPEQRLDRVERILGYFVREGRRWRVRSREQDEKINILIQSQMETTEHINKFTAGTTEQINKLTVGATEQINKLTAETTEQINKLTTGTTEQINKTTEQINKLAVGHALHEEEMAD